MRLAINAGSALLYNNGEPVFSPNGLETPALTVFANESTTLGIDPFVLEAETVLKAWFLGSDNEPDANGSWQVSRDGGKTLVPVRFTQSTPRLGYWLLLVTEKR